MSDPLPDWLLKSTPPPKMLPEGNYKRADWFEHRYEQRRERLALAVEKLKECAGECAECDGTGIIAVGFPQERDCDSCADIREVIAKCEAP